MVGLGRTNREVFFIGIWETLEQGWIKVNSDGASKGNLSQGCSFFSYISKEIILALDAKCLGVKTNSKVETKNTCNAIFMKVTNNIISK